MIDGCGRDVVEEIQVENLQVSAPLAQGQPGTWEVSSTVVSGIDGHQTRDSWSFRVRGKKDCSAAGDDERAADETNDEDESSFPIVPVVGGTLALVIVAVILRVLTGRSSE